MANMKKLFCITIAVILFVFLPFVVNAINHAPSVQPFTELRYKAKQVKVGISNAYLFSEKQEDGSYQGITIDYLQEISKYAGWKIEIVEGTSQELQAKFERGEIDLMGGIIQNADTVEKFDFAIYSSGYSYTTLNVLKDNDKYRPMDYNTFSGMRVGIYSKAINRIPLFNAFMEANGLALTPVYYDNHVDYLVALQSKEVDAVVTNDTTSNEKQKTIAKFGAVPYYFAVNKGETELLRELNSALATILEVNPKFDDTVYEKYINKNDIEFNLSQAEIEYIRNAAPLRAVMVADLAPIEYYDKKTRAIHGISVDVLQLISKKTGLQFTMTSVATVEEAKKMLLNGEADIITWLYDNTEDKAAMDIVYTRSYLNTQLITVKNAEPSKGAIGVVALPTGYTNDAVKSAMNITYYQTMKECMQAVIMGEADFTVFNNLVVDHYTYLRGNQHVSLTPSTSIVAGLSFGLVRPADPTLMTILDKVIYSLDTEEIQAIVFENTTTENIDMTIISMIYTYPMTFAAISAGVILSLCVTVILLLQFTRTRLKLAQQKMLSAESYRIIGELTDEYIFSYEFSSEELVIPPLFAQLTGCMNKQHHKKILEGSDDILKALLSVFDTEEAENSKTVEFKSVQAEHDEQWFKAIGTVLFNHEHTPIRGLGKIVSIQEEKQEMQLLEDRANKDALTGLYSRQFCDRSISAYFVDEGEKNLAALFVIDIDYFKQINDTMGHQAGDEVLKEFAKILYNEFEEQDIVGRWGGDEFIVFVHHLSSVEEITNHAKRLCHAIHREFQHEQICCMLSISVGIASTDKADTYAELFAHADAALYDVKNSERNGFKIYEA